MRNSVRCGVRQGIALLAFAGAVVGCLSTMAASPVYYIWNGGGHDWLMSNPANWEKGVTPPPDREASLLLLCRMPAGSVFTNDLPCGPYANLVTVGNEQNYTVTGNPLWLANLENNLRDSDEDGAFTFVIDLPVSVSGQNSMFKSVGTNKIIYNYPLYVPTEAENGMKNGLRLDGSGTQILRKGIQASSDCYPGSQYGTDKCVRLTTGTYIFEGDFEAPSCWVAYDAHVILSNATFRLNGPSTNYGFFHNCVIDIAQGGRLVSSGSSVMAFAQASTSYHTRINVLAGGVFDTWGAACRFADDGLTTVTIEDGGLMDWASSTDFSAGGICTVVLNGGRIEANELRVGYVKKLDAGHEARYDRLELNGGELRLNNFVNKSISTTKDKPFHIIANGGRIVSKASATNPGIFTGTSPDQMWVHVRKGGFVFDTEAYTVVWNAPLLAADDDGGDGDIVKLGGGFLTLRSPSATTGNIYVRRGTLTLEAPVASPRIEVTGASFLRLASGSDFAGALALAAGSTLSFEGAALSLTGLESTGGIVRLASVDGVPQKIAVTTADGLARTSSLRFELLGDGGDAWSANGTFVLMEQADLSADLSALARIANPAPGKSYRFAVADGALKVTVEDAVAPTALTVEADVVLSEAGRFEGVRFVGTGTLTAQGETVTLGSSSVLPFLACDAGDHVLANDLHLEGPTLVRIAAGASLTLSGTVTGDEGAWITVIGGGTLKIAGANAVKVAVQNASLEFGAAQAVGGGLLLGDSAEVAVTESMTLTAPVEVSGGASFTVPEGKTVDFAGAVSGEGKFCPRGAGHVTFSGSLANWQGRLLLCGVTEFPGAPALDPILFSGGTFLYTGAAPLALGSTLELCGTAVNALKLADGAGSLTAYGPVRVDSASGTLRLCGNATSEIALAGGDWQIPCDGRELSLRFSGGDFRIGSDCRLSVPVRAPNARAMIVGTWDSGEDRPSTVTIDDGASVEVGNLYFSSDASSADGTNAPAKIVQNGGRVCVNQDYLVFNSELSDYNEARYVLNGGELSVTSSWTDFVYGNTVMEVNGGVASLRRLASGWNTDNSMELAPSGNVASRARLEVNGGVVKVKDAVEWNSSSDPRRWTLMAVNGGELSIPSTDRQQTSKYPSAVSASLSVDGGTVGFTGASSVGPGVTDYLYGLDELLVGARGGTVDVRTPSATVTQPVRGKDSSGGDLVKTGAGDLTLASPVNQVFGAVDVREGALTAKFDQSPASGFPEGLVALWTFEGDNPLADKTGHGYDLVQMHEASFPVQFTPGDETIGRARNGTCAYWPVCGGSLGMTNKCSWSFNSYTVSFWTKLRNFDQGKSLISFMSTRSRVRCTDPSNVYSSIFDNYFCICLKPVNGKIRFDGDPDCYAGVSADDVARHFAPGEWHLVTSVREGSQLREYIDGQRVTTAVSDTLAAQKGAFPFKNDAAILLIGQTYGGFDVGNEYLNAGAMMDDIAIFSRALNDEEIASLYASVQKTPVAAVKVSAGATYDMNGGELVVPMLAGAGTVANGALTITERLQLDPAGTLHVDRVGVAANSAGVIDLGRDEGNPVRVPSEVVLFTYDELDAGAVANLGTWLHNVTGTGRDYKGAYAVRHDVENKRVVLELQGSRMVIIIR